MVCSITLQGRNCFTEIKDSGERREFESGAVRDIAEGKGRCDLLPLGVVADFVRFIPSEAYSGLTPLDCIHLFMTPPHDWSSREYIYYALLAFCKYNDWDVQTMLLEVSKHFEAGCAKYGERNWEKGIPAHCYIDSAVRHYLKWCRLDEDEPHDRAFCWNLLCLLWTMENRPECNDIWGKADGDG